MQESSVEPKTREDLLSSTYAFKIEVPKKSCHTFVNLRKVMRKGEKTSQHQRIEEIPSICSQGKNFSFMDLLCNEDGLNCLKQFSNNSNK